MGKQYAIKDFQWWLNLTQDTLIKDNQFTVLKNFFYNSSKQLQTRYGYTTFGNLIWTSPITSYFFFQRDDTLATTALCVSGTKMYKYDETSSTWKERKSGLTEYETITGLTTHRTRWDWAVYKNIVYMCNGVDSYAAYNSAAFASAYLTGWTSATSVVATWNAVTDGSFRITIDGTQRDITGLNFSAATTMANVATIIQTWIRAATWSLETCVWSTNKFIISSVNLTSNSAITVASAVWSWTDISWAGWTAFMDCDSWAGDESVTNVVTGYTEYAGQPKVRYLNIIGNTIFWAGQDTNPSTLYYSASQPADWSAIDTNDIVVGKDETGRINGIIELGIVTLAVKSGKIYSIDIVNEKAQAIDAHNGWYSNRSLRAVANSIVYFTDKGIDTLKPRQWVDTSAGSLDSSPLGEDVRALTDKVKELQYNSCAGWYNKALNNYYLSFDTNNDNIPDTTLVYSTLTKGWTQYTYPEIYDYWFYINSSNVRSYVFASATTGQMYTMETGYTDNGETISYELESKRFDFGTPGLSKTFDYVDVIGYASIDSNISVKVNVDGELASESTITNANLQIDSVVKTIWYSAIGTEALTWETSDSDTIDLYRYTFRVPMYSMGSDISFNMSSDGGVWILEQARISRDDQPVDVFSISDIG